MLKVGFFILPMNFGTTQVHQTTDASTKCKASETDF